MGVSPHDFSAETINHVGHSEEFLFPGDLSVENNLVQEVPQLFLQVLHVSFPNGLGHFVRLLPQMFQQRLVGLFAVPGATAGGAQLGLDAKKISKSFAGHRAIL